MEDLHLNIPFIQNLTLVFAFGTLTMLMILLIRRAILGRVENKEQVQQTISSEVFLQAIDYHVNGMEKEYRSRLRILAHACRDGKLRNWVYGQIDNMSESLDGDYLTAIQDIRSKI